MEPEQPRPQVLVLWGLEAVVPHGRLKVRFEAHENGVADDDQTEKSVGGSRVDPMDVAVRWSTELEAAAPPKATRRGIVRRGGHVVQVLRHVVLQALYLPV